MRKATGETRSPEAIAEGFLTIAVENMANAIKQISVQRGYDVTEYALCCFGGAGGQHACLVADALGMKTVFIHPLAGVLSAYGMGLADLRVMREKAVEARARGQRSSPARARRLDALAPRTAWTRCARQGVPGGADRGAAQACISTTKARIPTLVSRLGHAAPRCVDAFEAAHRQRFGFIMPDKR